MGSLSSRQEAMLRFISEYMSEFERPPTVREIGMAVGISSTSVVDYNLRILERDGHLHRQRDLSRGITLPNRRQTPAIPVLGLIAAGQPIEAVENPADTIEVPQRFADDGCYALRVKGKSMIEDHIDDGDLVVIKPQDDADNGEIVVALIVESGAPEGEATLKRLFREGPRVRLQPANANMEPIYADAAHVRVRGKVDSVIRSIE